MEHNCANQAIIATHTAKIDSLEKNDTKTEKTLERLDAKMDKVLWYILGQTGALIVAVIGGLAVYALVG